MVPEGTGRILVADDEPSVRESVGYALTPTSVAVRIGPAIGRTGGVDVGECLR